MFDDNEEYLNYDRLVDESDDLFDDYDSDDDGYDMQNEQEFDCYYHNLTDELIDD